MNKQTIGRIEAVLEQYNGQDVLLGMRKTKHFFLEIRGKLTLELTADGEGMTALIFNGDTGVNCSFHVREVIHSKLIDMNTHKMLRIVIEM